MQGHLSRTPATTPTGSGQRPENVTWLDKVPHQDVVECLLAHIDRYFPDDQAEYLLRAGGDTRFSLWLRLADEHLATFPKAKGETFEFSWRAAFDRGWSPRDAALAAWSGAGREPQPAVDMHFSLEPTSTRAALEP
jgi:hypothetical protein